MRDKAKFHMFLHVYQSKNLILFLFYLFLIPALKTCYCDIDQSNTFRVDTVVNVGIGLGVGLLLGYLVSQFWGSSSSIKNSPSEEESEEPVKDPEPYRDDPDYIRLLGVTQRSNQRWMEAVSDKTEDVETKREFFLLSKKITTNWVVQWYAAHPEAEKNPLLVYQPVSSQEMLEYATYCLLEQQTMQVYFWDYVTHFFGSLLKFVWWSS
jgi:hypothetical protein